MPPSSRSKPDGDAGSGVGVDEKIFGEGMRVSIFGSG